MSKLEETNMMIDYITKLNESGLTVDYTIILADIAKSLAMIADKVYEEKVRNSRKSMEIRKVSK